MFRTLFCVAVFWLFTAHLTYAQPATESTAAPWAVTATEKEQLLDRAETTLTWFRTLDRDARRALPPSRYREKMAPMEIMQAAAILQEKGQADLGRFVREMFSFVQPTALECFEIAERLGDDMLESFLETKEVLDGDTVDSVTRIRAETDRFLDELLLPVEKMALFYGPVTPLDLMNAVDVLSVAGRPTLVRYYLRKFLEADAEPKEFAQIVKMVGSKKLMQIANNPYFAPQGAEAVAKIVVEAKKHWTDEGVLEKALEDWSGFDEHGRLKPASTDALHALWKGERLSLVQMIDKLGTLKDEKEAAELTVAILSFGPDAKEALAAALQSENTTLVLNAARGLATTISTDETWLLYSTLFRRGNTLSDKQCNGIIAILKRRGHTIPTREAAAAALYQRAKDYYEKNRPLKTDAEGKVSFWTWNTTEKKVEYVQMTVPDAYRHFAWHYARQAHELAPKQPWIRKLHLAATFDRTTHQNGLDEEKPLDEALLQLADTEILEEILCESMSDGHDGAALAAATLLGMKGNVNDNADDLLASKDGKPRVLVQATMAENRRVRFAALESIMALNPTKPFPGSSYVVEALMWFARADGKRILVSAHPKQAEAAQTAGYFIALSDENSKPSTELGYRGELAGNGKEAMRKAAESPDVEMLVIDLLCQNPPVSALVQEMRHDPRTSDIPIAVLTDKEKPLENAPNGQSLPTMEHFDRMSPDNPFSVSLSKLYPRVVSPEAAAWVDKDLRQKTGFVPVPAALRLEQAKKSLMWLREIIRKQESGVKIYHVEDLGQLVSDALHSDARLPEGLELAAVVKSAGAQAAIYEMVASNIFPMELRHKAGEAFEQSVAKFGVLLRGEQVQRLYDRYNDSETEAKDVQDLLSRMIDVVEKKTFE